MRQKFLETSLKVDTMLFLKFILTLFTYLFLKNFSNDSNEMIYSHYSDNRLEDLNDAVTENLTIKSLKTIFVNRMAIDWNQVCLSEINGS